MGVLVWDEVGSREYETGLDRGVLYLPDGTAVPWNGLTSIIENFNKEVSPVYYDGKKINDLVSIGDFSATMKAVTYPDEFIELEGLVPIRRGLFYADQPPQAFGLCYRTQVGNDLEGAESGYKIHILYNVVAIPTQKTYATLTADPSLVEFEWNLSAVPEDISGFYPTSHIVLDTTELDPWLLEEIEEIIYGSSSADASLVPMSELTEYIANWYRVKITDNGDGTWTASAERDGFIFLDTPSPDIFTLRNVNAVYTDEDTFVISDTFHILDVPQISIEVNITDGTWTATTDHDGLIIIDPDGTFEIRNANATFLDADTYQISDTTAED